MVANIKIYDESTKTYKFPQFVKVYNYDTKQWVDCVIKVYDFNAGAWVTVSKA